MKQGSRAVLEHTQRWRVKREYRLKMYYSFASAGCWFREIDCDSSKRNQVLTQKSACHRAGAAPGAALTPSECYSQQVCVHPPTACQQISDAAGPGGCLRGIARVSTKRSTRAGRVAVALNKHENKHENKHDRGDVGCTTAGRVKHTAPLT